MNDYLRNRIGVKLLFSYLVVVLVGIIVLAITSQWTLPSAFNHHMGGLGLGMMNGRGGHAELVCRFSRRF